MSEKRRKERKEACGAFSLLKKAERGTDSPQIGPQDRPKPGEVFPNPAIVRPEARAEPEAGGEPQDQPQAAHPLI